MYWNTYFNCWDIIFDTVWSMCDLLMDLQFPVPLASSSITTRIHPSVDMVNTDRCKGNDVSRSGKNSFKLTEVEINSNAQAVSECISVEYQTTSFRALLWQFQWIEMLLLIKGLWVCFIFDFSTDPYKKFLEIFFRNELKLLHDC